MLGEVLHELRFCVSASGEVSSCRSSMTRIVRSRCSASSARTLSTIIRWLKLGCRGRMFAFELPLLAGQWFGPSVLRAAAEARTLR